MNAVVDQVMRSTAAVVDALETAGLEAPSQLPGWSRLTIACHLRYGAEAMRWMTEDAVAGRATAYYPAGRAVERDGTLVPRPEESPADVVRSLRDASDALHGTWRAVDDWSITVTEPPHNVDLGPHPLSHMPLFRLTEIEVHGTDLDLGLPPWSDVLIREGLPMRLDRLARREPQASGAWRLVATDCAGDGLDVTVGDGSQPELIEASSRDLFALTLGRVNLSDSFSRALPGP